MSSLPRRMQRKVLRSRKEYEPSPQQFDSLPDGGYKALHPTRGWKTFSARRLRAMANLAVMREGIDVKMGRMLPLMSAVNAARRKVMGIEPDPVTVIARQQGKSAARGR